MPTNGNTNNQMWWTLYTEEQRSVLLSSRCTQPVKTFVLLFPCWQWNCCFVHQISLGWKFSSDKSGEEQMGGLGRKGKRDTLQLHFKTNQPGSTVSADRVCRSWIISPTTGQTAEQAQGGLPPSLLQAHCALQLCQSSRRLLRILYFSMKPYSPMMWSYLGHTSPFPGFCSCRLAQSID